MVELWNEKKTHSKRLWKWIPKSIQSECSTLHCNPTTMHSIIAILSRFCMFKLSFDFRALCRIIPTNWHKFVSDNSVCVFFLCRGLHSFFCCYFIFYIYFLFGPEQIAIMNYGRSSALLRSMYIGSISLRVRGALVHMWLVSGSAADILCILCIYICAIGCWSAFVNCFVGRAAATAFNVRLPHLKGITIIFMFTSQLNPFFTCFLFHMHGEKEREKKLWHEKRKLKRNIYIQKFYL